MIFIVKIESNKNLFETLESMGDFFLIPRTNDIILHTKLSRVKVCNRIKKISEGNFDVYLVDDSKISNYPPIVQHWNNLDKLENKVKSIDYKKVEKEALYRLSDFVDTLEKELKNSTGKEVINCRIK